MSSGAILFYECEVKLNKSIAGIYKITNTKTNKIYIGESVNVITRLATHFSDLDRDKHINLEMQHDFDLYGNKSFEYELIEKTTREKSVLRALEEKYIARYTNEGKTLYNGGNDGFLHVKERRDKIKNEQRAKRALHRVDKSNVRSKEKSQFDSKAVQGSANCNMASDQSKSHASIAGKSNGKTGVNGNAETKGPKESGVDENRRSQQSNQSAQEALSKSDLLENERVEIIEQMIWDWPPRMDDLIYLLDVYLNNNQKEEIRKALNPLVINFYFGSQERVDLFDKMILSTGLSAIEAIQYMAEKYKS